MIFENLNILKPFISSYQVITFEQIGLNLNLKVEIRFIDKSVLFVKEIVISGSKRKYSYHFQNAQSQLICRWDNAPDWPELYTFPHHKHTPTGVEPSTQIESLDIFNEIKKYFTNDN